jgi:hypothetical protein
MWTSIRHYLKPMIGLTALSAVLASPVRASDSEAVYQCRVLGNTSACASLRTQDLGSTFEPVPGPYAQYLMYLGHPKDQAIAEASLRGESPSWRLAKRSMSRQLTGDEAHEKFLGRPPLRDGQVAAGGDDYPLLLAR